MLTETQETDINAAVEMGDFRRAFELLLSALADIEIAEPAE